MPKERNGLPIHPKKWLDHNRRDKMKSQVYLLLKQNPKNFVRRTNKWLPIKPPIYSDIDFGDKDTVLPYKGQGVVLGTKESLQEATNYYSRNNAKATNNQEVTLAEEQEYQQAIIKALDGEELFDVVDNPTHIINVKDSEGNVVDQLGTIES